MMKQKPSSRKHRPIIVLTVVLILNSAALVWLGGQRYRSHREDEARAKQNSRLEELRGEIIHLDEVLTMSARMAAATGDLEWEERYRRFEPKLDAAIKEAMTLAPESLSGEAAAQTDAANIKLVEMENRAFELVRQGRTDDARAVLFCDEYETQKGIYAQGMARFAQPRDRYVQLRRLRGAIIHLDEVLTMSARMAAITEDPMWESRYRRFEPKLDYTIKEALALAPGALTGEAAARTDAANLRLVAMENQAFDLVRQGRPDEALALLSSDEYETQKRVYAKGMKQFAAGLAEAATSVRQRQHRYVLLHSVALAVLISLLAIGWATVYRAVRRWHTTIMHTNRRLAGQAEELRELNLVQVRGLQLSLLLGLCVRSLMVPIFNFLGQSLSIE